MKKDCKYGKAICIRSCCHRWEFHRSKKETKRLKMISPRRRGKTSIVTKVRSLIDNPKIRVVMMDIYDCRSEFDFYERFATAIVDGVNSGYMSEAVLAKHSLGTKSNISRIIKTLNDKELIEKDGNTIRMADPVFFQWFKRECKK